MNRSNGGTVPPRAIRERVATWIRSRRRTPLSNGNGVEARRYLARWLALGTSIGIVAGLGSVLFARAIDWATHLFLGHLVGYAPPLPLGEGHPVIGAMDRAWLLPVSTALGGLLAGIVVFALAPEAEGHGTDAAIAAIHHRRAFLRGRVVPVKLVASAITIGSGGSAGREGPAAQISAGFGSLVGRFLDLEIADRRIAVSAGMGAGIGAIFRAPLGGAVMAAEILYIHDLEVEALIPSLIASIVGYTVFGVFQGWQPIFGAQPDLTFDHPVSLVYYGLLGIACGAVGLLYARTFYGVEHLFHRLDAPRWIKPALGGLVVGCIGIWIPGVLHTGYGYVQIGMSRELLTLPLWVVLALPFAKIVATSLSIGSGGSGGIFGPGMVIGGALGAAFWRLGNGHLPQLPDSPAPFVIVGMMALFGGIAHAPLAMMLMVAEMTGNLSLLAPAMVAVALSTALTGDATIYRSQLPDRASSPAHRVRFSFPLLASLAVADAVGPPQPDGDLIAVQLHDPLDVALEQMIASGATSAAVVDGGHVVGSVDLAGAIAAYRKAAATGLRRTGPVAPGIVHIEGVVVASAPIAGKRLRDAGLPADSLVVGINRDGEALLPAASLVIEAGDTLTILSIPERAATIRACCFAAAGVAGRVSTEITDGPGSTTVV